MLLVLLLRHCPVEASAKECTGSNLDAGEKLRVGIKHRPDICKRRSKKGDLLSMHYEGKHFNIRPLLPYLSYRICLILSYPHSSCFCLLPYHVTSGKLYSNCSPFDSSRERDSPFTFVVGSGQVCICICMCICLCVCMSIHLYVFISICLFVCII